jgi:hypothetical protein
MPKTKEVSKSLGSETVPQEAEMWSGGAIAAKGRVWLREDDGKSHN